MLAGLLELLKTVNEFTKMDINTYIFLRGELGNRFTDNNIKMGN